MNISPIDTSALDNGANTTSKTRDSSTDPSAMQDRFLKLLVAQLNNQDPMNPLDNAQVTSQLAQISTVRGIEQLNQSMGGLVNKLNDSSPASAVGMLGRQVLAAGSQFEWAGGEAAAADEAKVDEIETPDASKTDSGTGKTATPVRLGFELASDAKLLRVEILDSAGKVVATRDLANVSAGVQTFEWDGAKTDGGTAASGNYQLRVYGADTNGAEVAVTPLVMARVLGITQGNGGAQLELSNGSSTPASGVKAII